MIKDADDTMIRTLQHIEAEKLHEMVSAVPQCSAQTVQSPGNRID
jgi:hypothetical protein